MVFSKYEAAQLFSLITIIHIWMISEGSRDTKDWSNDTENTAVITGMNYILKYIKIENGYFKLEQYFTLLFYCTFDQMQPVWALETSLKSLTSYCTHSDFTTTFFTTI